MGQNTDMFKKLKSIFVLEEEGSTNSTEESTPSDSGKINSAQSGSVSSPKSSTPSTESPDQKFTEMLLKAIEASNTDGFDYIEYRNSLKSIEKVIPDESTRFKSAFEMAKTMGLTKEKLLQSANFYVNILANENKKFNDAVENQKAKNIQGKSDQIAEMEKNVKDKQSMIEQLNKDIATLTKQLQDTKAEIGEAVNKIEVTNQRFLASYTLVNDQIQGDIEKIKVNL